MDTKPSASIVKPVRDGDNILRDAIQIVLQQTIGDIEVIMVDDHSEDRSMQIIEEMAAVDGRIRPTASRGKGLVDALETGRRLARGPIIVRMDADDVSDRKDRPVRFSDRARAVPDSARPMPWASSAWLAVLPFRGCNARRCA